MDILESDQSYISQALAVANQAYLLDEVPVGALVVSKHGELLSEEHNRKESDFDPTAHAEILALRSAAARSKGWRLSGATLYVTLEPCPMCLYAMISARVERVVFGAYDPKGGALSLGYNFHLDQRLNHSFSITGGVMHYECSQIISRFFREKRDRHSSD
jgi:tRNA(adenine34) deaminase